MTDTKVYARCSNPKVDYLTDGKLYEVVWQCGSNISVVDDRGDVKFYTWDAKNIVTWTRVEQQGPPQWALDKTVRPRYENWADFRSWVDAADNPEAYELAEAHAATLAKYETEPVDPVLEKAREIHAKRLFSAGEPLLAQQVASGEYDQRTAILSIMEALRLPAMGGE